MIRPHQCPVCQRECAVADEASLAVFPFCSERCRNIDLARWFGGRYAITEDLDPLEAELLQHDPDITVQRSNEDQS